MNKIYKRTNTKLLFCALSTLLITASTNAATLTFKSDEATDVNLVIEPGVGTVLPNKESIKAVLHPKEKKVIEVTKDTFGTETFSVTGKVILPSIDNKCTLLSVETDYIITFTAAKAGGTICKAEKVSK